MKNPQIEQLAQKIYASDLFNGTVEGCTLTEKQNLFLVCGGLKPVSFVTSTHKKDLGEGQYEFEADDKDLVARFLSSLGLFSEVFGDVHTTEALVSLKAEYLKQLDGSPNNHRLAGTLYGYPSSAIDAFLAPNKSQILDEEQEERVLKDAGIPDCFPHFNFSVSNYKNELEIVKKWYEFCKLYGLT